MSLGLGGGSNPLPKLKPQNKGNPGRGERGRRGETNQFPLLPSSQTPNKFVCFLGGEGEEREGVTTPHQKTKQNQTSLRFGGVEGERRG